MSKVEHGFLVKQLSEATIKPINDGCRARIKVRCLSLGDFPRGLIENQVRDQSNTSWPRRCVDVHQIQTRDVTASPMHTLTRSCLFFSTCLIKQLYEPANLLTMSNACSAMPVCSDKQLCVPHP